MGRHAARVLVVVAVLIAAAGAGWAQAAARGTVNGSVSDANGAVTGLRVVISSASSSYTATVTTDQRGEFTFSDVPAGGVEVKVYDAQENVLVSGKGELKSQGQVITLALSLP